MSINPEEWKLRRVQKERQRKEKEAKQRKKLIRIGIALAIAAVGIALVFFVISRFTGNEAEQPEVPESTEIISADSTEQATEELPEEEDTSGGNTTTIHIVAGGDVNVTDKIVSSGGYNYDYTNTFMDMAYLFGDADLAMIRQLRHGSGQDGSGGNAGIDGLLDIGLMGGEEEIGLEGVQIRCDGTAAA